MLDDQLKASGDLIGMNASLATVLGRWRRVIDTSLALDVSLTRRFSLLCQKLSTRYYIIGVIYFIMWSQLARSALSGTAITVGSLTVPCIAAVYIERAANRALFTYYPEKFSQVEHALGIEDWELQENKRKSQASSTLASELLPVTMHEEKNFTSMEFEEETPVQQVVPPRYGISISDKNIFTCALTS